jgi:hypothetical protein
MMTMLGFLRAFLTAALLTVVVPPLARAAGDKESEHRARKACLSGNYQEGVEILSDLFISTTNPIFIYNQARCYELNGRCGDAIPRFREYLRKAKDASADERAETEKHISDCQALLMQEQTGGGSRGTVPPAGPPLSLQPRAAQPGPRPKEQVVGPVAPTRSRGQGLRIAGIVCGLTGIASIGTGIYFYTRARYYSVKVSNQFAPNPSDDSAGKNAQTMQWVFYGVGGAALATGVVLYALGWRSPESPRPAARVVPIFGRGVAGLSAEGAF